MLPREELLKGVENREEIAKVIDKAEQAIKTWEVTVTDFLSPAVLAEVERVFQRLTDVSMEKWGGYPQAERQRLGIARVDLPWTVTDIPLSALDIAGNFLFDTANHRDFLGAMLGTILGRIVSGLTNSGSPVRIFERYPAPLCHKPSLRLISMRIRSQRFTLGRCHRRTSIRSATPPA